MIGVGFIGTLCWPPDRVNVWAQLPAPNPLIAPVAPPSAPATLAAPVTVEVAPSLVLPPSPPTPTPTPSVQTFNCSCYGPGSPTAWMGQVQSTSYFNARQTAQGACVAYNVRSPSQPAIPSLASQSALPSLPASASPQSAAPQGVAAPESGTIGALPIDATSEQGQPLPGTTFSSQTAVNSCLRCSCS